MIRSSFLTLLDTQEGDKTRGKREREPTATSTPSAHMCPSDIGSRYLLDACSLPSHPTIVGSEGNTVWPGLLRGGAAAREDAGRGDDIQAAYSPRMWAEVEVIGL